MPENFEIIEHPADVGFTAFGATFGELLENAALAMLTLACDPLAIVEREQCAIHARGADDEALLFDWLAEILAVTDAEGLALKRASVTHAGNGEARGTVFGEAFDKSRHRAGTYIKAVTYHQLSVVHDATGWRATVYLDV